MDVQTTRFGLVEIDHDQIIHFPKGILGMEDCHGWVLLADAVQSDLGWLQSTQFPEVAMAVVSPRRFVPEYQIRVARRELMLLSLDRTEDALVVVAVNKNEGCLTVNLKAPLVINRSKHLGCQVVTKDDYSVQHKLHQEPVSLKKTA